MVLTGTDLDAHMASLRQQETLPRDTVRTADAQLIESTNTRKRLREVEEEAQPAFCSLSADGDSEAVFRSLAGGAEAEARTIWRSATGGASPPPAEELSARVKRHREMEVAVAKLAKKPRTAADESAQWAVAMDFDAKVTAIRNTSKPATIEELDRTLQTMSSEQDERAPIAHVVATGLKRSYLFMDFKAEQEENEAKAVLQSPFAEQEARMRQEAEAKEREDRAQARYNEACPFCFAELDAEDAANVITHGCKHASCKDCHTKYVNEYQGSACALCKQPFAGVRTARESLPGFSTMEATDEDLPRFISLVAEEDEGEPRFISLGDTDNAPPVYASLGNSRDNSYGAGLAAAGYRVLHIEPENDPAYQKTCLTCGDSYYDRTRTLNTICGGCRPPRPEVC